MQILVIATPTFAQSVVRACEDLGHEVKLRVIDYERSIPIYRKIFRKRSWYYSEVARVFNQYIKLNLKNDIESFQPDMILVLKGMKVSDSSQAVLQQLKISIALWTTDSKSRFPDQFEIAPCSKYVFTQDVGDAIEDNYIPLPLGFDEHIFDFHNQDKNIDVLFIGNHEKALYTKRRVVLQKYIEAGLDKKYKTVFVGSFGKSCPVKGFKNSAIEKIGRVPLKEYAGYIASSKVVYNIHQDDGEQPVNPMLFAIPYVGSLQIVDYRHYLKDYLKRELFIPLDQSDHSDLEDAILKFEQHQRKLLAQREWIRKNHTFKSRINYILKKMVNENR